MIRLGPMGEAKQMSESGSVPLSLAASFRSKKEPILSKLTARFQKLVEGHEAAVAAAGKPGT